MARDGRPRKVSLEAEPTSKTFQPKGLPEDYLLQLLKSRFPNGHSEFLPFLLKAAKLHNDKNFDYAAGGNPLGNFNRASSIFNNYPNLKPNDRRVVALIYMIKQLDAYLYMLNNGHESVTGEGLRERIADVAVYAIILYCMENTYDEYSTVPRL